MRILLLMCFIMVSAPVFSKTDYQSSELEKMTRVEISEILSKEIEQRNILEQIKSGSRLIWQELPKIVYIELISRQLGCYPSKSYFRVTKRDHEFFESTQVPIAMQLIDDRFLIVEGSRKHEADVKGLFIYDLKEKEAVISLLNYSKGALDPIIDIYVSQKTPSETLSKGVEIVRDWIEEYMTTKPEYSNFTKFPPFTIYTSRCSD